jgi:glycosyltransferase involved in cell wall biosynthesis
MTKPQPFHLALFLPSLDGGGAQRITLNLAQGLLQIEGVQVDLVLGRAQGSFLKDIPAGVRLVNLDQNRMLKTILPLARYLRSERPDALVSALDYANVAAVLASVLSGTGIRTAVVTHIHLSSALARLSPWKRRILSFLIRKTYMRAHAVIAVSKGVADDMVQRIGIPPDRIRVIYNPVIGEDMLSRAGAPPDHPWLNSPDIPVILAVGRLTAQKDFATLIRAVAWLRIETNVRLIILGEGEQRSELQFLAAQLKIEDSVDMPGFVANPCSFMWRSAVVALSSRWEALPTVIIEALHCGARVVSTDCPCGPSEILLQGKYGQLVPMADATALASALAKAIRGDTPRPPMESWKPYLISTSARHYLDVFGVRPPDSAPRHTL